jgi:hypothetical protein
MRVDGMDPIARSTAANKVKQSTGRDAKHDSKVKQSCWKQTRNLVRWPYKEVTERCTFFGVLIHEEEWRVSSGRHRNRTVAVVSLDDCCCRLFRRLLAHGSFELNRAT